jgi:hypothetical protein
VPPEVGALTFSCSINGCCVSWFLFSMSGYPEFSSVMSTCRWQTVLDTRLTNCKLLVRL